MPSRPIAPSGASAVMAAQDPGRERGPVRGNDETSSRLGTSTAVAVTAPPQVPTACPQAEPPHVGAMLRRAREARGVTALRLAQLVAHGSSGSVGAWLEWIERLEADGMCGATPSAMGMFLAALDGVERMSSREMDAMLIAARIVPADVRALLLAAPEKLDALRSLLGGTRG